MARCLANQRQLKKCSGTGVPNGREYIGGGMLAPVLVCNVCNYVWADFQQSRKIIKSDLNRNLAVLLADTG